MAYRAEFSINRIGESAISPSDRVSLLAEVRDCLIEEIQEGDSHAEVESDTVDEQAYAKVDEERGFIRHLGGRLYSKVRDYLEKQIGDSDSRTDVESDATDDHAYAQIYAERHFDDKLWRLNVRLYSNEDELRAEVFFGAALDDEVSSRPAPAYVHARVSPAIRLSGWDTQTGIHNTRRTGSGEVSV